MKEVCESLRELFDERLQVHEFLPALLYYAGMAGEQELFDRALIFAARNYESIEWSSECEEARGMLELEELVKEYRRRVIRPKSRRGAAGPDDQDGGKRKRLRRQ